MNKSLKTLGLLTLLALGGAAQAAAVQDQSGFGPSKVITFNAFDGLITTGEVDVGTAEIGMEVKLTSGPFAEVGANNRDLGENGLWTGFGSGPAVEGHFLASSFTGKRGELGFSFATGLSSVGAYVNQFRLAGVNNSLTLLAYDKYGNTLESFTYSVKTEWDSYDQGQFLGFKRASADIYGFGVAGNNIVLDNLTVAAPVPEPESYALLLAGLGVLGLLSRRRLKA